MLPDPSFLTYIFYPETCIKSVSTECAVYMINGDWIILLLVIGD